MNLLWFVYDTLGEYRGYFGDCSRFSFKGCACGDKISNARVVNSCIYYRGEGGCESSVKYRIFVEQNRECAGCGLFTFFCLHLTSFQISY